MVSRLGIVASVAIVLVGSLAGSVRSQPPIGTSIYSVRVDPRLCPSPLCGGYWVSLANAPRTRCVDGTTSPRCYAGKAIGEGGRPLDVSISDGALVRAALEASDFEGIGVLGILAVADIYAPAGGAPATGGFQRLVDTGVRCIRAPCFSFRATRVNGTTRATLSGVDVAAARVSPSVLGRAEAALRTKNGLLARGRFLATPDGGRVFRASRLFLRATQPRA